MTMQAHEASDLAAEWYDRTVGPIVADAIKYRRENPCFFAKFHELMAQSGPRWLRPWHRFRRRIMAAKCAAFSAQHGVKCPIEG